MERTRDERRYEDAAKRILSQGVTVHPARESNVYAGNPEEDGKIALRMSDQPTVRVTPKMALIIRALHIFDIRIEEGGI